MHRQFYVNATSLSSSENIPTKGIVPHFKRPRLLPCTWRKIAIFFSKLSLLTEVRAITVNGILRGVVPHLIFKKIREKRCKCNECDLLQVLPKFSWTTFKTIFETLSALGACHVTIIGGVVFKKCMIFEVFLRISRRVFDISS